MTVGYIPSGKRIVKKAGGETKTEAKAELNGRRPISPSPPW
ncbi:hypothetical protein [Streptosporangium minutum]|nr:hypothetical protein [Streptosporangium minutum]